MKQADAAIDRLKNHVDAMIVVANDRLLDIVEEGTPLQEAFCVADDILRQGVVGISEIIVKPGEARGATGWGCGNWQGL